MKNSMIYIYGKLGTGRTILSDEIEKGFVLNDGFNSIKISDSNMEEIISNLDRYKDTLLIIQSNLLNVVHMKALKGFIENSNFNRGVIIKSEFKADKEIAKYCYRTYETGYPYFSWVTQVDENRWEAKRINSTEIYKSNGRVQAIESARRYNNESNKD